ncbi:MAG: NADH-quinone oxidoreductase subunit M [Bacteroidota bacterium]|nr:NADH-quinone oxidoreductase subunit M [Bacteroidota bacterium]MDP4216477.1 NADH-quinone oxidoreductase subunit M [Bacteroidota bacterium]MDP4246641.1 NADH-quinone oxidoreductase subunit M [Bacteroidota bacterium]MDP4253096.1 NADH-quinone oxidoreductase subunit M [Bacteroidota bacterium]MDP4259071.1 NADH-quinone oxidoreductase subunit M [Bacteroidota bacterium]
MNLSLFIIIPLVTAVAVMCCRGLRQARWISLAGSLGQLLLSFVLLFRFGQERAAGNSSRMLFEYRHSWFAAWHIDYHIGVDGISVAMILLTAVIVLAGVLVSWNKGPWSKEFFSLLLILALGAYGFFLSLDLFTMFFFLELSVIPKYLLIGIWGSGRKEYSAMKLALMLMSGSALVFIGLLGLYYGSGHSFDILQLAQVPISAGVQRTFFPCLFIGFGIFTALFPLHTWVPDGHSSAPTAASMFLAGISMKLGAYGCLRVATYLMPDAAREYAPIIIVLATIAIVYGAFATMMQKDLKYINAYSSVSHCGFILLGIGMLTRAAINGAVLQMISHGLMTALFFASIGMIYDRAHTRMVDRLGGLLKVMPFISTIFVIAGLCSLGLPGLSSFVAEITVFIGSWQHPGTMYRLATILACASIVITAVYILRASAQTVMGPVKDPQFSVLTDAAWYERLASILLVAGIVVIGVAPFWLNDLLKPGIDAFMVHAGQTGLLK